MLDIIGWLGAVLFALCGLPQAIKCHKEGHADGLDWYFLGAWTGGEILTIIYVWPSQNWPLLFNYLVNMVFLLVMLKYKIRPRGESFSIKCTSRHF